MRNEAGRKREMRDKSRIDKESKGKIKVDPSAEADEEEER